MPRPLASIAVLAAVAAGLWYWLESPSRAAAATGAMITGYCTDCHNPAERAGELNLEGLDAAHPELDPATWERVVRKLRTGMMPPAGEPRPPRATLDAITSAIEHQLDRHAEAEPVRTALRRLNRTEYQNAIRDLLRLDIDAATLLPLDDSSEGFDNIATALGVSPALIEAYVSAAMKVSRRALGDATATETQVAYLAPTGLSQDRHLPGMPLGTRGGLRVEHEFPLDAEYEFRIRRGLRLPRGIELDITLDGEPVTPDDPARFTLPISAGPHTLTFAMIDNFRPGGIDNVYAPAGTPGTISGIDIVGPLRPTGVGDTPSRRHILSCEPGPAMPAAECAEAIISAIAAHAFRRPPGREDLDGLLAFYAAGAAEGGFENGIQQALARILVDPRFLYRLEREPATLPAGTVFAVDAYALATRLAFFLWSSIPDAELLALAASGELQEPGVLLAQAERMLADPKAAALTENFAAQWLFLRELDSITPDAAHFDENLRRSMRTETEALFDAVRREDLSVLRLLDADFTFVDERLARHYGIPGIRGSHLRRIDLPADSPRRGLLGHASILTLTSVTSRTSPVIRGSWILETLLGSPAPVPPPNVETTLEGDDGEVVATTVRERLEAHRANPTCASCHAIMDPIGFALENFDLTGAWRETDAGRPIDASGTLADGTAIAGPGELRAALLSRADAFVTTLTERLMTYALGRGLEAGDMPAVRAVLRDARDADYRFSALVLGIVQSEAFLTQVKGTTG